jgi:hypothetical protein
MSLLNRVADLFRTNPLEDQGFVPGFASQQFRDITKSVERSPDLGILEQYEFQLLFCPDYTQRGCHEYPLIEESVYLASAFSLKRFNYQQRDGLCIPLPSATNSRPTGYTAPSLKVKGELHAIRPWQFQKLDSQKDNLVSFRRERVKVLVPHSPVYKIPHRYDNGKIIPLMTDQYAIGAERIKPIEAWMYVAQNDYWGQLIDGGFMFNHVTHYKDKRPWLGAYYSLKREEYF